MSTTADLMGLGMPPALADRLGNNPSTVAGAGTTQTGAAVVKRGVVLAGPTSSNTAFILSVGSSTGGVIWFWNTSASQTALVYPPVGGTINGGSANASVSVPPLAGAYFQLQNGTGVAIETWGAVIGDNANDSPTFTNLTLTGTLTTAANSSTLTPIEMQPGALNTSSVAGGIEFDGRCFYGDVAASQRGVIPTESVFINNAAITLLSQTAAQGLFIGTNGLTNGEVTLPLGTYEFECEFALSSMSATSGSFGFALGTANSAVIGSQLWSAFGIKAAAGTATAVNASFNTTANVAISAASTATAGWARIKGTFTLTTAGSIIPEVSLANAAAVVVSAGSYFKIKPLGSTTVTAIGNWS